MTFLRKHFLITAFLVFFAISIGYKFIAYPAPFYDWDESIYAQVGREMVEKKTLIPLWQGDYWLDKPPLVPFAYGVVLKMGIASPELSTRFFTLLLTLMVLALMYALYYRVVKEPVIPALAVVITAFVPIFLQRVQVLNVDVFLLLGWLGYLVFFRNFWLSFLFLAIGFFSKSLLGFYPVVIVFFFYTYRVYTKKISLLEYRQRIFSMIIQSAVLVLWYFYMYLRFGNSFIQAHFLESHFKRVSSSIESHFGQRTFYLDALVEQFGFFKYLFPFSIILIGYRFYKKKDSRELLLTLFFVPWFVFLNATKTKIAWYLYPVIPQFSFLSVFVLQSIRRWRILFYLAALVVFLSIINSNFIQNSIFRIHYSSYDAYYYLSLEARSRCRELFVLVDKDSRTAHDTLKKMGLLISTSEWWGNHPAIVYYFGKPVHFVYDRNSLPSLISREIYSCSLIEESDREFFTNSSPQAPLIKKLGSQYLFRNRR